MKRGRNFCLLIGIFIVCNFLSVFGLTAITNCTDLQNMKNNLTESYYLTKDINCSDTINWNSGAGFEQIGGGFSADPFYGNFEGRNYTISNLFINRSTTPIVGFIGYLSGGNITDVRVSNIFLSGWESLGCLVGYHSSGKIVSSSCSGIILSSGSKVGGLVGEIDLSCTLFDSYSRVNVSGSSEVGGLIGWARANSLNLNRSYSTGNVSGSSNTGGLVGLDSGSNTCANSFWDNQTSGQTTSACGTGKNTADMKNQTTFTDAGWDFTNIWKMSGSVNDGYPYLRAFEGQPQVLIQVIYPTQNINVTRYSWFNITVNVTCLSGADCGNINVSLDPETGRVIAHSANFPDSNIKIVEKFPEKQEKRNFFSRIIEFFKRVF